MHIIFHRKYYSDFQLKKCSELKLIKNYFSSLICFSVCHHDFHIYGFFKSEIKTLYSVLPHSHFNLKIVSILHSMNFTIHTDMCVLHKNIWRGAIEYIKHT